MHIKLLKLLNAEPSGAPTSGAPPGPSSSASPPAQGNATGEPPLLEQLTKLIDTKLTEQRNGIFADLRKAGALGKAAKAETNDHAEPKAPPAPAEDVQALIARERAFNRAISTVKLSDTQFARMEKAFQLEKPDNPAEWVKSWVADLGIGAAEGGVQQSKTQASPRSAHPVSDSGAPAPVSVPSDQIEPWRLSEDDVNAAIRRDGYAVAGAKFRAQMHRALMGRRIRLR